MFHIKPKEGLASLRPSSICCLRPSPAWLKNVLTAAKMSTVYITATFIFQVGRKLVETTESKQGVNLGRDINTSCFHASKEFPVKSSGSR